MPTRAYDYVIVGGGLAGASAVDGIREIDKNGGIALVGREPHLPYDRPPLSKQLWFGKKKVEEIFIHDREFYSQKGVELVLGREVVSLDADKKRITDSSGEEYVFKKLLIATGGTPRSLPVAGGDLKGICYYRYLDDYLRIKSEADAGKTATIIGGGFIGSEIAAALTINKAKVTMIFPGPYLLSHVFPAYLGTSIQRHYTERGITIFTGDRPTSFIKSGKKFIVRTEKGKNIESDMVIAGIGIAPSIDLAKNAGLKTGNGIEVNDYLQTSHPDIYAAGDNALFPYIALSQLMRIEHWDNALNQGKWAGQNMAGLHKPFTYMPYFFSDLFEFGFEAVGEVSAELETFADWQKENDTGVIYYLKDGRVRGVMLCNVWEKVNAARELILKRKGRTRENLRGAIRL